jgi:hypothetical protein
MLPKLTFNSFSGEYIVPGQWTRWDWINSLDNYPDPDHSVFTGEYDWDFRHSGRGVLSRYIRTMEGYTSECFSSKNTPYTRNNPAKPYMYYLFALAAVELINNPDLYRDERKGSLNGSFVVNYANSIDITALSFLPEREGGKKYLISTEFAALFARVFNAKSGVRIDDSIKVELREDKKGRCPNCEAVFELLSRRYWEPGHPDYEKMVEDYVAQNKKRQHRNTHG